MTEELKARIAQINAGTAPAGYKKTKVGIVPEEWDIIKLSSISTHRTEKNKDMKFTETYTNSATQGIIRQTDYFDKQISNNENIDGYYIVCENDYVYNPRISVSAPCGPISKSHIPEPGIMSPLYTVFRLNREYENNAFIEYYFKSPFWHRYMTSIANYGARHDRMNITNADLFGMPIPVPPLPEQQKIAEILTAQDAVIALMQKQIELLQKQKKAFLQKMFPKKGCNVPEIRFAGFTDAWEQRELGEVFTQTASFVNPKEDDIELWSLTVEEGLTPKSERYTRDFLVKKEDNFKEVRTGDIVYNPMNMTLGAIGYNNMSKSIAVSGYYVTMFANSNTDSYFINTWMKSPQAILTYKNYATGSLKEKQRVQFSTLSLISVPFPTFEEQQAIGTYFKNLDTLITLHQRKLEFEQKKKKALMQLLLTGKVRVKK